MFNCDPIVFDLGSRKGQQFLLYHHKKKLIEYPFIQLKLKN